MKVPEHSARHGRVSPVTSRRPRILHLAAALFIASAVLFSTPLSGVLHSAAGAATSVSGTTIESGSSSDPSDCPGGVSQCETFQIPCGTSTCPTIVAGPTLNVGNGEYVYLSMSNFPVGDDVRVALCPITDPPQIVPTGNPSCSYGIDSEQVSLTPIKVPVTADGTLGASFPTQVDPSGEDNPPIAADDLVSTAPGQGLKSFYCDDGPDYCGLEVEEFPSLKPGNTETTSNTAIIPLSFAAQSNGCPSSDPLIDTSSAYSLEHFIPAAVDSTCRGDSGVADLNTATENGEVIDSFTQGGSNIIFSDDPQDPAQIAALSGLHYRYVPIAVSATVVAFLGGDYLAPELGSEQFPISSYKLTPNMVAGLITSDYSQGYGSDLMMPPLVCKDIAGCGKTTTAANFDTFDYLNPVPANVNGPLDYGMFFSSSNSGASYQVSNWACDAPNVPFTVTIPLLEDGKGVPTQVQVTDDHTAQKTMIVAPEAGIAWPPPNDPTAPWPYTACKPYDTLPVLAASSGQYSFASSPALQAKALRGFAYGGSGQPAFLSGGQTLLGFGAMDWSEASYYGLNSASLQNASGNFVTPSESSIDAALSDATTSSDGVIQYNYDASNPDAYPMPLVTYAIVSTATQPAATQQAEGDLLTNLVCYSNAGGSKATPLPTGYVPLPQNLYQQARTEISQMFPYSEKSCNGPTPALPTNTKPGAGKSHTNGSGSGTGGSGSGSDTGGSTGSGSSTGSAPSSPSSSSRLGVGATVASAGGIGNAKSSAKTKSSSVTRGSKGNTPAPAKGPGKGFEPVILAVAEGAERWIVAGLGAAALLGLIIGPLVVLAPRARRKLLRRAPTET